ncbi:MAG TPA: CBO0543 family protein [Desulfosporosinus sp.]|nr:CBO0543 family protein [Desulfosporosinus sp.]
MIKPNVNPLVEKANDMVHKANVLIYESWLKTILFTWRWWILILLAIGSWTVWFIWRDKNLTHRLLYAGLVVTVATFYMDTIGIALGLWSYPIKDIPLIPSYVTWDFCIIPVASMITLQYKPNANPFIKAMTLAIIGGFIVQPVATRFGYYQIKHWHHAYSFLLIIIIYLLGYYFYNGRTWKTSLSVRGK